jgi:nucleotide-binding universal stress UspA family protein
VDGSAESAAALRWACREASLREAEVHAVHVREAKCHSLANYAVPAYARAVLSAEDDEIDEVWRSVLPDSGPGSGPGGDTGPDGPDGLGAPGAPGGWGSSDVLEVQGVAVRTEIAEGLAARILLDRCAGADMLVLGTAADSQGASRSAGPVIRALLRRAPCPVVVISTSQDPGAWNSRTAPARVPVTLQSAAVPVGV